MDWSQVKSIQDAKEQLIRLWDGIKQPAIDSLCQSFPMRVKMVRDADGQTIQPLLSNHRTSVPSDYLPDRPTTPQFVPWTKNEDALLHELCQAKGESTWQKIASSFPGRSVTTIKNRWRTLEIRQKNEERGIESGSEDPGSL
jgi:hypothetical protein